MQYLYMIVYVNDQRVRPPHATFCLSVFIEKLKIICMIFLDENWQSNFAYASKVELYVIIKMKWLKNI